MEAMPRVLAEGAATGNLPPEVKKQACFRLFIRCGTGVFRPLMCGS